MTFGHPPSTAHTVWEYEYNLQLEADCVPEIFATLMTSAEVTILDVNHKVHRFCGAEVRH